MLVKDEHRAVQLPAPRGRWRLHALVSGALTTLLLAAQPVLATEPPDLSASKLSCADLNGGTLRPGDVLKCTLVLSLAADTENATVTATVPLPSTLDTDPTLPPPAYDTDTRTIILDQNTLGYTFSGQQRVFSFHVTLGQALDVGTSIDLSILLTGVGDADSVVVHQTANAPVLAVAPPPADLADSEVTCEDLDGGTLLPGDQFSCTVDAINSVAHEDATFVNATLTVPGGIWVSGGVSSTSGSTHFDETDLGDIAVSTDKTASATFKVPLTALGGDTLVPFSFITGSSTPSSTAILQSKVATPLVVSPGPAVLLLSSLICTDTNGGILLAGDDVTCTVTVHPSAGHEDVHGSAATVTIPDGASYVSGGDAHDASSVTFETSSLGDVIAGQAASVIFHMKIANLTVAGTLLQPTGLLTATSVPLGGAISQPLTGTPLVVGQQVVQQGERPTITDVVSPPPDVRPPVVVASKAYKLKAKTIHFVMRRGHRRGSHLWRGSKRRFAFVKKFIVRTPKISGKVVKKVTVPKKGKWAPKHGVAKIKATRLRYTLKKGVDPGTVRDRFHYTVTDTNGKKVTGTVVVTHRKS